MGIKKFDFKKYRPFCIFHNWKFEDFQDILSESVFNLHDCDEVEISKLRKRVWQFKIYGGSSDLLLVNAEHFHKKEFGIFLMLLEEENLKGYVWFYGLPIHKYPVTLISRCDVVIGLKKSVDDSFKKMLNAKDSFVDFLVHLEQARPSSAEAVLSLSKKMEKVHFDLFREWWFKNEIFTDRELALCPFLRGKVFETIYNKFFVEHLFSPDKFFLFLVCYKLVKEL